MMTPANTLTAPVQKRPWGKIVRHDSIITNQYSLCFYHGESMLIVLTMWPGGKLLRVLGCDSEDNAAALLAALPEALAKAKAE